MLLDYLFIFRLILLGKFPLDVNKESLYFNYTLNILYLRLNCKYHICVAYFLSQSIIFSVSIFQLFCSHLEILWQQYFLTA